MWWLGSWKPVGLYLIAAMFKQTHFVGHFHKFSSCYQLFSGSFWEHLDFSDLSKPLTELGPSAQVMPSSQHSRIELWSAHQFRTCAPRLCTKIRWAHRLLVCSPVRQKYEYWSGCLTTRYYFEQGIVSVIRSIFAWSTCSPKLISSVEHLLLY